MIQSKILDEAAGIQYQGVKDESEPNQFGSVTTGYLIGYFKRGFVGKSFTVTKDNFQALLGHDPSNPDYLAVEDVFNRGVPSLQVLRIGSFVDDGSGTGNGNGNGNGNGGNGGSEDPNDYIPQPEGVGGSWEDEIGSGGSGGSDGSGGSGGDGSGGGDGTGGDGTGGSGGSGGEPLIPLSPTYLIFGNTLLS